MDEWRDVEEEEVFEEEGYVGVNVKGPRARFFSGMLSRTTVHSQLLLKQRGYAYPVCWRTR